MPLASIYLSIHRRLQIYLRYIAGGVMLGCFFDHGDRHGCGSWGHRSRGRWGFEGFMEDFWGPGGPRGRWRGRAGRVFEQGDLKYVILRLLAEKPRHGYEIIKELEERFSGA